MHKILPCILLFIFTSNLFASDSDVHRLLNYVRTHYLKKDVNHEISQLEKLIEIKQINLSEYGLGKGIFNFWRKKTSDNELKRLATQCQKNKNLNYVPLESHHFSSNVYVHYSVKSNANASIITAQMAQKIFMLLKGQEINLAHSEYTNACESRAQKMAKILDSICIESSKAFIESKKIQLQNHEWSWGYHVAPIILVKNKYRQLETYILDPALFDMAKPLYDWVGRLRETHYYNHYHVSITSKYIFFPRDKNLIKNEYSNTETVIATQRILKQRFLRMIRFFLGPIEQY